MNFLKMFIMCSLRIPFLLRIMSHKLQRRRAVIPFREIRVAFHGTMFAKLLYTELEQLCKWSRSKKLLLAALRDGKAFAGLWGCVRFALNRQLLRE